MAVPQQRNNLHCLTTSVYRRTQIFNSERFNREFITTLAESRAELGFGLIGYVLMPEHSHLLVWPSAVANPSLVPVIPRSLRATRNLLCSVSERLAGKSRSFVVPLSCGGAPQDDEWSEDQHAAHSALHSQNSAAGAARVAPHAETQVAPVAAVPFQMGR